MAIKPTTFRAATESLETKISEKVNELNVSKNQYINDALELYSGFDTNFLKTLRGLAADMSLEPWDLIQRRLTQWFGKINAYCEIYGTYPHFFMDTITQKDFENDYNMHKQVELNKLEKDIVLEALENEKYGIELEEYQKLLLVKYHRGKAWLESEEYQKKIEMDKYIDAALNPEKFSKEQLEGIKSEVTVKIEAERSSKKED